MIGLTEFRANIRTNQVNRCYEMKCITRVPSKFDPQIIEGKYGTSPICSARTIREILTCFYHVFAETCNYRILFYSVSDYINQRKIVNQ